MKIKEVILYYEASPKTDSSSTSSSWVKPKSYTDSKTIQLFEIAKPTKEFFLWKGSIGGVVFYDNGDSSQLKISRYGAYFINLNQNQAYSFSNTDSKKRWQEFVESFLNSPSDNP
jgi:hypothetical protein